MSVIFERSTALIGTDAAERLQKASVMVFGAGGVGGYAIEALVRCGVGKIIIADFDDVKENNINRQIIALQSTVGAKKTSVFQKRITDINPDAEVCAVDLFVNEENADSLIDRYAPDFIIEAIDTVTAKVAIIKSAKLRGIPMISSMGTANKLNPSRLKISDISKTHTCPLARAMRVRLKNEGVSNIKVLWSDEAPSNVCVESKNGRHVPASMIFVPASAGLLLAHYAVKTITGLNAFGNP